MRKIFLAFLTIALAAIFGFIAVCNADAESVGIEVRSEHLVGNELRLLVETYATWLPPLSHSSKTANAKGYLVTIDLASKKPLPERARVIGPIWDVPNPRSSISFQAGANFTKDDAEAAAATPVCDFDRDGTLLRFTRDRARKITVRDALVIAPEGCSWKRQGDVQPVRDDLPWGSENRVRSESGRYILLYQNGKAECRDLFTGAQIEDAWLTQAFAQVRSIENFDNTRLFLTEDLNHLVVSPMAIWNDFPRKIYKTFDYDGKTHTRADVGLAYSRPAEKAFLFPRKMDEKESFLAEPPFGAFSIGGELYLFASDESTLRLYSPDGQKEIVGRAPPGTQWEVLPYPRIQHAAEANELVMFRSNAVASAAGRSEVVRWNYTKHTVTCDDVSISDLFERRDGQLSPKSAVEVK